MDTIFFRLLDGLNRPSRLSDAVLQLREGGETAEVYSAVSDSFRQVSGSTIAYWVSERVRRLFVDLPSLQESGRHACVTNPAGDDQRYFRCSWEVPEVAVGRRNRWVPLAKGGAFSRYHSDVHLLIDWDENEQTYRGFKGTVHRPLKRPASVDFFFRPGITYSTRTQLGFSARILPEGSIFHAKGPGVFCGEDERFHLLALFNSKAFQMLLQLQMAFGSYEVGVVQRTPIPDLSGSYGSPLDSMAIQCVDLKRSFDSIDETTHAFHLPALLQVEAATLQERLALWQERAASEEQQLAENQREIDNIVFQLYGIEGEDRRAIEESLSGENDTGGAGEDDGATETEDTDEATVVLDGGVLAADLLSYVLGCVFELLSNVVD